MKKIRQTFKLIIEIPEKMDNPPIKGLPSTVILDQLMLMFPYLIKSAYPDMEVKLERLDN